jgi:uncharacterized protein YebE (UPF0316 family)
LSSRSASAAAIVFTNLDHPIRIIALAAGFATGTMLGGFVERKLAMGTACLRIAPVESPSVAAARSADFRSRCSTPGP